MCVRFVTFLQSVSRANLDIYQWGRNWLTPLVLTLTVIHTAKTKEIGNVNTSWHTLLFIMLWVNHRSGKLIFFVFSHFSVNKRVPRNFGYCEETSSYNVIVHRPTFTRQKLNKKGNTSWPISSFIMLWVNLSFFSGRLINFCVFSHIFA